MRKPWTSTIYREARRPLRPGRARGGLARFLLAALLPLVLGPLITVAFLLYRQARLDITSQVTAQLNSLSILKENQIDLWAADRQAEMGHLALVLDEAALAQALIPGTPEAGAARQALQARFDAYLATPYNRDFNTLLLAHAETGEVIAASASGQSLLGQSLLAEGLLRAGRTEARALPPAYNPLFDPGGVTVLVVAPVGDGQANRRAVLVGVIPDDRLADIVAHGPSMGQTSRAYLVSRDGYELGAPIAPETVKPASLGIQRARMEQADGSGQYANPQGDRVVGVYNWLPRHELALLIEQNEEEAYAPIARAATLFAIVIALAFVVSTVGVLIFTRRLTRPIQDLTDGALRMAGGDLSRQVPIGREDEIGLLAQAFNSMVADLRTLYQELENKVESRTRQLAAAAEVGRAATSILRVETLLARAAELIRDRFGYYHVSIFLLDEAGQHAWLRESTGEAGAQLKAEGYHVAVGEGSLVGWVAANNAPRVASEAHEDPASFRHALLPDTRAEAALPLRIGDRTLGVLDVHSRDPDAFGPADVETLQILADQMAVAVENGRLFARQQRVVELEQTIAHFTTKIHQSPTFETILESAATELGRALGARRAVVRLKPPSEPGPPGAAPGNGQRESGRER